MKLPHRRQFLHLAASTATLPVVSRVALAQAYPTRPVRIVVGYGAGGATDTTARLIGQWLSERLGQPFIIENRTGFAGNIATEAVVRAAPDGYTLLLDVDSNAFNVALYDKLNFSYIRDISPVAGIINYPFVMVVNPSFPATTVPEFITYAKANPGKVNMASAGVGSGLHLCGELFNIMAGVNMIHVPYRGSAPALIGLIGGEVQVGFLDPVSSIEYVKAGKVRALAVTTATRSEVLPNIPTVGDFVPGYEARGWNGLGAPKNTSTEIVNKLNKEVNAALTDPGMKARLADLGGTVFPGLPADFGKHIADETEKWSKVVRAANIKPE